MPTSRLLAEHRSAILRLGRQYGAEQIRVFGSGARGELRPESDIDLLVRMGPGRTLLDHVALKQDLEALLGRPVDLVTEAALHPAIRERVVREAIPL